MRYVFAFFTIGVIFITFFMFVRILRGPGIYDRFVGIMVVGTNAVLVLVLIGFWSGRVELYLDIAASYAVLGFITSVIVAKFLGSREEEKDDDG